MDHRRPYYRNLTARCLHGLVILALLLSFTGSPASAGHQDASVESSQQAKQSQDLAIRDAAPKVGSSGPATQAEPTPVATVQLTLSTSLPYLRPGQSLRLSWQVSGLPTEFSTRDWQMQFQLPDGLLLQGYTPNPDGILVTQPLKESSGEVELNVATDVQKSVMIRAAVWEGEQIRAERSLALDVPMRLAAGAGGWVEGLGGKVRVYFPGQALADSLDALVGGLAEWGITKPGQGQPFRIEAYDLQARAVHQFSETLTLQVQYTEAEINGDEATLALYYLDETSRTWHALPSQVDTQANRLTAQSDHLSIFSFNTVNWEAARLPGLQGFQTAPFSGSATYSYPIATPPGRGGLQPGLALTYNSQPVDSATTRTQAG